MTCTPGAPDAQVIPEPVLIVEVLSPSTAAADLNLKLPDCRAIPSVQDVLVVSSMEWRVEHWRREADGWKVHDLRGAGTIRLQAVPVEIDLGALYGGVLPEGPGRSERAAP